MHRIAPFALVCFLSFHVLAVGIESVPKGASDPVSESLKKMWQPITRPYARLTGQWQTWNLFAPDPLTRVSSLYIDVSESGEWQERLVFSHETFPRLRSTNMLKMVRHFSEVKEKYEEPRREFLLRLCIQENLGVGKEMRARFLSEDLLKPSETSESEYFFTCSS